MLRTSVRKFRMVLAITCLVGASMACGLGSAAVEPTSSPQPPAAHPTAVVDTAQPIQVAPPDAGMQCEGPVTEISLDTPVEADLVGGKVPSDRRYFCIVIAGNIPSFTVTITGLQAILNIYVGYPDLETLQNGGLTFWQSEQLGTVDKTAQVTPLGSHEFVETGTYYIEVSAFDFNDSSHFTLTATVP